MQYKTKGAILRSKVRWYEDGERNTRYFYNLEKRNYEKKTIAKLKRSNGTVTNDQFEILREQMEFIKPFTLRLRTLLTQTMQFPLPLFLKTLPLLRIRTSKCVKERSPLRNA